MVVFGIALAPENTLVMQNGTAIIAPCIRLDRCQTRQLCCKAKQECDFLRRGSCLLTVFYYYFTAMAGCLILCKGLSAVCRGVTHPEIKAETLAYATEKAERLALAACQCACHAGEGQVSHPPALSRRLKTLYAGWSRQHKSC